MTITYQIRRTGRRSKNISVRVYPDASVRVSAPTWASLKDISRVVQMHAEWIADQVVQARASAPCYDEGALHFYVGKRYPLAFEMPRGKSAVTFTGRRFVIATDNRTPIAVRDLLRQWYRGQAAELFAARVPIICADLNWLKALPNWRLRRMRAQWGSCSESGDVTLNTQLVKAPLPLIDYVILHEVAHIKHHDHGRGFERLMDMHLPNWRDCRRDLNTLGATILVD